MLTRILDRLAPPELSRADHGANIAGIVLAALIAVGAVASASAITAETGAVVLSVLLLPVVLAAWFGGVRAWLVFMAGIIPAAAFVITPPAFTTELGASDDVSIVVFAVTSLGLLVLVERLRFTAARTAQLVDDLARSNEAKTEFVQHVSHELRTPMTIIEGNAAILRDRWQALDASTREGALTDIVEAAKRLEDITANLLSLARLGAGYEVEREPVIVAEIANTVVERHRRRHPGRRYAVEAIGARLPVLCAPVYLVQVVENLLSNAEKYSPDDREITVRVNRASDTVSVAVLDRGKGLRAEEAQALFEPFYRSDDTAGVGGLGIGLSVCRRFAEAEGGSMSARPRDGGGPPAAEAPEPLSNAAPATESASHAGPA